MCERLFIHVWSQNQFVTVEWTDLGDTMLLLFRLIQKVCRIQPRRRWWQRSSRLPKGLVSCSHNPLSGSVGVNWYSPWTAHQKQIIIRKEQITLIICLPEWQELMLLHSYIQFVLVQKSILCMLRHYSKPHYDLDLTGWTNHHCCQDFHLLNISASVSCLLQRKKNTQKTF